jgi:hypothetical protein
MYRYSEQKFYVKLISLKIIFYEITATKKERLEEAKEIIEILTSCGEISKKVN